MPSELVIQQLTETSIGLFNLYFKTIVSRRRMPYIK